MASAPGVSGTVQINSTCYTGDFASTAKAFGDSATMGFSIIGMIITGVFILIFGYISFTSAGTLPRVMLACCALSLASTVWQYFMAKMDIDSLKSQGKLKSC